MTPPSRLTGAAAIFDGLGSSAAGGATISSSFWSFSDGPSQSGGVVVHTFKVAGSVRLTVTDSQGRT